MDGHLLARTQLLALVSQSATKSTPYRTHRCRPLGASFRRYSSTLQSSRDVRIVEVGPRDGLQNIKQNVPTATKVELIQRLSSTGLRAIEATSFVSPKWVPQLADGAQVLGRAFSFAGQPRLRAEPIDFPVLAPNLKGLENASAANAKEIVVFASVTEAFSKANQNCSVEEALRQAEAVTKKALSLGLKVRGVVSCIFSDPFSGPTPPEAVVPVVQRLIQMGCYEVGLGDTLGVGTPADVQKLLDVLLPVVPASKLAGHYHDTYGQGIGNIVKSYEMGIRTFDSSVAGLGGCPYAPGARGNVATEDVVYTLERAGIRTGVKLDELIEVGQWISKEIGIPYGSRVGVALMARKGSHNRPTSKKNDVSDTANTANTADAGCMAIAQPRRTWKILQDTGEYRLSRSGTCVKVTLTRSKNGNALTVAMLEGLTNFYRNVAADPTVYHIVLESEGKYFCTGMDLSGETNTSDMSAGTSYYDKVFALYDAIDHVPQTTISVVDGPCFGGGVGLTFVCDVRLVSARARWTLSEIKIGVSPAVISKFLVREWGPSVAREGMISGREVCPEELFRIGAVHAIVDGSESLGDRLEVYLDQLDRCAPRSAAINKELTRLGWDVPESATQANFIKTTFSNMMAPSSEGEHGIQQFQRRQRRVDWRQFWAGRNPYQGLKV